MILKEDVFKTDKWVYNEYKYNMRLQDDLERTSGDLMPTRKTLKLQKKNKSRLEILKSWMSSFVVTAVAVVAAISYIPASPQAEIISLQAFEQEIVYQVDVRDPDHALDLSTLKVVLTNQFGSLEVPLSLGMNVGYFQDLSPNTDYVMKVYGSKGFGLENLVSQSIKTSGSPGGAITGYRIVSETEYDYDYLIDIFISDPESLYESYVLDYGYAYHQDDQITYQSEVITESRTSILIEGVSAFNVQVHLVLKGVKSNSDEVILDQVSYHVPFKLESSVYLDLVGMEEIIYNVYPDSYSGVLVTYTFNLYQGAQKMRSIDIVPSDALSHYGSEEVILNRLKSSTLYRVEVIARYVNPYTLRSESEVIYEEEVSTLPSFTATIEITEYESYYEVEIFVIDPSHLFQIPYITLFEVTGDQRIYLLSQDFYFTPEATGKRAILTIDKPQVPEYQLIIGIRNTNNYTIRHILFDEVINP
jgi:hypothetical protein